MMNAKMTFVQYSCEDVIATSGGALCFGAAHFQIVSRDSSASKPGQHIFVYNAYEYDAVNGVAKSSSIIPITIYGNALRDKKQDEGGIIVWNDNGAYVECTSQVHGQ